MTIKPLGNRLVVKLVKQKKTSASGIILSTKEENEQSIGEVVSIASGVNVDNEIKVTDLGLKAGDKVMFGKYSGEEVKDDVDPDTVYKILKAGDIIALVS